MLSAGMPHPEKRDENTQSVTVVILNYNSGDYLRRCLEALSKQNYRNFSVIVGDNGSNDTSFHDAKAAALEWSDFGEALQFIEIGENTGFARGNNMLVEKVSTPLVALLNPDTEPKPNWLCLLVDASERYPDACMFGSTQLNLRNVTILDGTGDAYLACGIPWRGGHGHADSILPDESEVFSPCAAAALYRTEAFRSVDGFDETFFCYVEDVDLGFRLRLRGNRCIQVRNAIVLHAGGGSSEGNGAFARYYGTRNLVWTFVKNMPGVLFWCLLPGHICALAVLASKAIFRGDASPVLRGIRDAVTALPRIWKQRKSVQRARTESICGIIRFLCWSPVKYVRRMPVTWKNS